MRIGPLHLALALAILPIEVPAQAQNPFGDLQAKPAGAKPPAVTYLFPEQVSIPAGKPSPVDLHFKIGAGLHVNSHTPRSEELIPTTLKFPEDSGVQLSKA